MDPIGGLRSVELFGREGVGERPKWVAPACARRFTPWAAAAGLVCLCSGVFHTCMFVKFTPVYSETECGDETAMLDRFEFASSVDLGMDINVTCRNPNPYSIEILASTPGRVFIELDGKDARSRFEIGTLRVISGSSLRERGAGSVAVRMDAQLSGAETNALLPHVLEDPAVRVLMELQFEVGVYVSFGLGQWGTSAPFRKKCGLQMAGLLVNRFVDASSPDQRSRLGPLVCRGDFEGMRIPGVGEEERIPEDGRMGFTAAQVAPAEVAAGERTKNLSLLTAILLSFSCGFALLYYSWLVLTTPRGGSKWPLGPSPGTFSLSALTKPRGVLQAEGMPEDPEIERLLRGGASEDDGEDGDAAQDAGPGPAGEGGRRGLVGCWPASPSRRARAREAGHGH